MAKRRAPSTRRAIFRRLRDERETDSGVACVAMAEKIFGTDGEKVLEWKSRESRQWAKLGVEIDKVSRDLTAEELQELKDKLRARQERSEKMGRLRGNVVQMPGGG